MHFFNLNPSTDFLIYMDMQVYAQVIALCAFTAVLCWAVAGGPLRLFPSASQEMMVFNALMLLGAMLAWPLWGASAVLTLPWALALSHWCMLAAVRWLCASMHTLHQVQPTYVLQPAVLPVLALFMAVVAWLDASGLGVLAVAMGSSVWMLGLSLQQVFPSLMAQTGTSTARWALLPMALAALLWLVGLGHAVWVLGAGVWYPGTASRDDWSGLLWLLTWCWLNAGLAGMVLLRLMDKIQELSTQDDVTGALNIQAFMALLASERDRLRRHPQMQSVLLCTLDQHEALCRQLGFAAGDAALRQVTTVIGRSLRKTDRLGGTPQGELILFLPDTPAIGAILVAERTQALLSEHPLLIKGQSIPLTLSMGVASRSEASVTCEALLDMAFRGAARARREGGNRVRVAGTDPANEPDGIVVSDDALLQT